MTEVDPGLNYPLWRMPESDFKWPPIKTLQLNEPHEYRNALVYRASFVPAPFTWLVAVAWILSERRFHETCLLIRSEQVPSLAGTSGLYYELHFRPAVSSEAGKLDKFRAPVDSLPELLSRQLE